MRSSAELGCIDSYLRQIITTIITTIITIIIIIIIITTTIITTFTHRRYSFSGVVHAARQEDV